MANAVFIDGTALPAGTKKPTGTDIDIGTKFYGSKKGRKREDECRRQTSSEIYIWLPAILIQSKDTSPGKQVPPRWERSDWKNKSQSPGQDRHRSQYTSGSQH